MSRPEPDVQFESCSGFESQPKELLTSAAKDSLILPVVREELDIETRRVITGTVRIRKVVHEREELVDQPVVTSNVEIERVPVNRIVDGPLPVRHEGETVIYPVVEEVLVITKQFVLKEELRITYRISEARHRQHVNLRTEELVVDREEKTQ